MVSLSSVRTPLSIIDSGELGQLINVVQVEPVGFYHFAHSYVRGNWSSEQESSFVLLTKCQRKATLISSADGFAQKNQ